MWGRRPLLTTAEHLAGFADLFSLEAVDELVSRRGLRTPFLRVARGGTVVPAARYTRSGGTGAQVGDQVVDDRLLDLFVDGHTLVLQGLHRVWPALVDFAGQLVTDLGHPVQVNAYVTPSESQGFCPLDRRDIFVLQVAGGKRWRSTSRCSVAAPHQPWTDHRAAVEDRATGDPVIDTVLRPGDSLYLPRGYLHAAEALGGATCHLTVGVHPVTRHDLLKVLVEQVADDEHLRASLPFGVDVADPADVQPDLDATVGALLARIRTVSRPTSRRPWQPRVSAADARRPSARSPRPRLCAAWHRRRSSPRDATSTTCWSPTTPTTPAPSRWCCPVAGSASGRRARRPCGRCWTVPGSGSTSCPGSSRTTH